MDLVEEAVPGVAPRDRLLSQDLLFGLAQQVGAIAAHCLDPVPIVRHGWVRIPGLGGRVRRGGQLELEEDEFLAEPGAPLRGALQQRATGRCAGVGRPIQVGVGADPGGPLADRLVGGQQFPQRGRVQGRDAPAVRRVQLVRARVRAVQIAVDGRVVAGRVEVGQVPGDLFGAAQVRGFSASGEGIVHRLKSSYRRDQYRIVTTRHEDTKNG